MESAVMTSAVMSSQSTVGNQQMRREVKEMKRRRTEETADGLALMTSSIQQMLFALKIQQSQDTSWKHMFNTSWTIRRKQQQHPVVSYNESAVAIYPVASFSTIAYPVDLVSRRKKSRSSEAQQLKNELAAKQLTTYEEISKLDVNC
ncbi:20S proteasome alpha subunit G [Dorcoceras hygrometricum]|uniref:20S proteasome alpha subunit G n=1 Tax=Dorcoceras hygrometricum TaxID=472368 RepID=A0A2Z7BA79_9LAMI|nr:20S proteasome alpha subunit G [Dorcoceras hygrometricum]